MPDYEISDSAEMKKRTAVAKDFFEAVLDPEDQPYFVSDEACLYDIFAGDDDDVVERCRASFGFVMEQQHFKMPVWKLLDLVFAEKASALEMRNRPGDIPRR